MTIAFWFGIHLAAGLLFVVIKAASEMAANRRVVPEGEAVVLLLLWPLALAKMIMYVAVLIGAGIGLWIGVSKWPANNSVPSDQARNNAGPVKVSPEGTECNSPGQSEAAPWVTKENTPSPERAESGTRDGNDRRKEPATEPQLS